MGYITVGLQIVNQLLLYRPVDFRYNNSLHNCTLQMNSDCEVVHVRVF